VELLYDRKRHILNPDCAFVVAKTTIDLLKEIHWPGQIDIGTGILRIGQSSIVIGANLYQNGHVVATSETIVVQVSEVNKTSVVLSEDAKKILTSFLLAI
jgi:acyl-CoA thioester hydrolase